MGDVYIIPDEYSDELYHHGILGQRWYVRRFQNEDGTLTAEGRIRYGKSPLRGQRDLNKIDRERAISGYDAEKYKGKSESVQRKMDRYIEKRGYGKNGPKAGQDSKYDKLRTSLKESRRQYADANRLASERRKEAVQLVKNLENMGYSVTQSPTSRVAIREGEVWARSFLMAGMLAATSIVSPMGFGMINIPYDENSTQYKVRRNS